MNNHTLQLLLGLSVVGFVVVSVLYMMLLQDVKWKLWNRDNRIRQLEQELNRYQCRQCYDCGHEDGKAEQEKQKSFKFNKGGFSALFKVGILAALAYLVYAIYKRRKQRPAPVTVTAEPIN